MATIQRISASYRSAKQGREREEVRRAKEAQASQELVFPNEKIARTRAAASIIPIRWLPGLVRFLPKSKLATACLGVIVSVTSCFHHAVNAQAPGTLLTVVEPQASSNLDQQLNTPLSKVDQLKEASEAEKVRSVANEKNPEIHTQMMTKEIWDSHSVNLNTYLPIASRQLEDKPLQLSDVIASVYRAFPIIEQSRLQAGVTAGQNLSAWGAYDTKIEGYTLNQPLGFYETYRHGLGAARQTWWGGYLGAGYRIGRGSFEPWYKERETNDGGEFKLALIQPLLQGRAIDAQRVEVFQTNLRRQAVTPEIQANILSYSLEATEAYWYWLSMGATLKSQNQLLELAETRGKQIEKLLAAEQGKQIDLIVNDQLIAERRGKVIETEQKLWQAAAKLSLFLRDEAGQPIMAPIVWLSPEFSAILDLPLGTYQEDFANAMSRRPELQLIEYEIQQNRWALQLANNQLLPNLDFTIQGSQDTGAPASSLRDKSQFELEAGVVGNVPVQRRKARGKIQETNHKLAQLEQKRRYQQDKISIELQNAHTALLTNAASIKQAREALMAAREGLKRYRVAFELGQVDLVFLNLVEPKVTEYEIKLIEQEQKWYAALAQKQAALGLDPLEQALALEAAKP